MSAWLYSQLEKCKFHVQKVSYFYGRRDIVEWNVPESIYDIQVFFDFDGYSSIILPMTRIWRRSTIRLVCRNTSHV